MSSTPPFAFGQLLKIHGQWQCGVHRLAGISWRIPRSGDPCSGFIRVASLRQRSQRQMSSWN
jgi:hypothetical protein